MLANGSGALTWPLVGTVPLDLGHFLLQGREDSWQVTTSLEKNVHPSLGQGCWRHGLGWGLSTKHIHLVEIVLCSNSWFWCYLPPHFWKKILGSNCTLKIPRLPGAQIDNCLLMFTAALFTIAKRWKQPSVHWWMNGQTKCGKYICINHVSLFFVMLMLWHLADPGGTVPPRASQCLEIVTDFLVSTPFTCKPTHPEPTTHPLLYLALLLRLLSTCPNNPRSRLQVTKDSLDVPESAEIIQTSQC